MAASRILLAALPVFALIGCGSEADEPQTVRAPIEEASPTPQSSASVAARAEDAAEANQGATPMAERVATLGLLNKRNNISEDIELKPGESREIGPVIIRLAACEQTAPWEMPQETGAFVQLDVLERGQSQHRRVFSGWLFKESPSLNVVEHPIYDVWVKSCEMSFPEGT